MSVVTSGESLSRRMKELAFSSDGAVEEGIYAGVITLDDVYNRPERKPIDQPMDRFRVESPWQVHRPVRYAFAQREALGLQVEDFDRFRIADVLPYTGNGVVLCDYHKNMFVQLAKSVFFDANGQVKTGPALMEAAQEQRQLHTGIFSPYFKRITLWRELFDVMRPVLLELVRTSKDGHDMAMQFVNARNLMEPDVATELPAFSTAARSALAQRAQNTRQRRLREAAMSGKSVKQTALEESDPFVAKIANPDTHSESFSRTDFRKLPVDRWEASRELWARHPNSEVRALRLLLPPEFLNDTELLDSLRSFMKFLVQYPPNQRYGVMSTIYGVVVPARLFSELTMEEKLTVVFAETFKFRIGGPVPEKDIESFHRLVGMARLTDFPGGEDLRGWHLFETLCGMCDISPTKTGFEIRQLFSGRLNSDGLNSELLAHLRVIRQAKFDSIFQVFDTVAELPEADRSSYALAALSAFGPQCDLYAMLARRIRGVGAAPYTRTTYEQ